MSDEHDAGEQATKVAAVNDETSASSTGSAGTKTPTGSGKPGSTAPVQRLEALSTPPLKTAIQRLTDPLGNGMVVDWSTPDASVALNDQAGAPVAGSAPLNFNGGDTANFTVPDRNATANVNFPVTASWHPKGGPVPPGPTPGDDCDACKVLIDGATANTCAFIEEVVEDAIPVSLIDKGIGRLVQLVCCPSSR